jgi:hypothetical protein
MWDKLFLIAVGYMWLPCDVKLDLVKIFTETTNFIFFNGRSVWVSFSRTLG